MPRRAKTGTYRTAGIAGAIVLLAGGGAVYFALRAPADVPPGPRAHALAQEGRYADAIAVLEDAVRRGPYDEGLHYDLGELMTEHVSPDEMIRFWSAEAAHDRKPQTSHYFLAIGLARSGNPDGAIRELRAALDIDPAHEMSQRLWGVILEKEGKLEPAYEHMVEAIRIHPEFRQALVDAARVARKLGRNDAAAELERRARTADPDTKRCYFYWARYLHAHGRDDAALREIERGLAVLPGDADSVRLRDAILAARAGGAHEGRPR